MLTQTSHSLHPVNVQEVRASLPDLSGCARLPGLRAAGADSCSFANFLPFKENLLCLFHHFQPLQINLIATGWLSAPLPNIHKTQEIQIYEGNADTPELKSGEHAVTTHPAKAPKHTLSAL